MALISAADMPPPASPTQQQQPRFYKYGDHYFSIIPLLRLKRPESTEEEDPKDPHKEKMLPGITIEKSHLAIFASGKRDVMVGLGLGLGS